MRFRNLIFIPFFLFLIASCASMPELSAFKTGEIPNGPQMKELQIALNTVGKKGGYNAGSADAIFGKKTRIAIMAFQKQKGLPTDGKPTYALLKKVKSAIGGKPQVSLLDKLKRVGKPGKATNKTKNTEFQAGRCINTDTAEGKALVNSLFNKSIGKLPIDIMPYLAGYCGPSGKEFLQDLYLYLVSTGATHARLTLQKYQTLVVFYEKAGIDLGVRKEAFQRSTESLRSDYQSMSVDRKKGAEKLLKHYNTEQARKLLDALPQAYAKLETQYRKDARTLMADALTHSTSATFYLARSVSTGKSLLDQIEVGRDTKGSWVENIANKASDVAEGVEVTKYVTGQSPDIKKMLVASTYSVKTLTQDIKDVPRVNQNKAHKELTQLRAKSGVILTEFESEFESEQKQQLAAVKT